jgi:hypothetical protein
MFHATNAGRTSGIEELIVIVLLLIGFPNPLRGRNLSGFVKEALDAFTHVSADQEEQPSTYRHDDSTDNRPLDGLETALVQHELLDLVQHFQLLVMSIPILPQP